MKRDYRLIRVDDYEPLVGAETVARIHQKARHLAGMRVCHINSTYYGGGVAELLAPLTLLMDSVGLKGEWRTIYGSPDFFSITKKMHNALQGGEINLNEFKEEIYEEVLFENAVRNHIDHEMVVIHDPQPLAMIEHYKKHGPWIWQCHVDLSNPHAGLWNYLVQFVEKYDAVVLTLKEYAQKLATPQLFFMPAINPFSTTNRPLTDTEMDERLAHYKIPTDQPLVVQVSRFDRWKDPEGVIEAVHLARREVDCTLVLLGNVATDDPEGEHVFESLLRHQDERTLVLASQDSALVNTLQTRAAVVLQKSLREGFGLTVAEAMWKRAAVVGSNVGGIRHQIEDGVNGFLVSSVAEAAERIVQLIRQPELRRRLGEAGHQTVRRRFLLTRLLEQYLDLFSSFETQFHLTRPPHDFQ